MARRKCLGKEDGCEVAKGAGSLASQDQWGDIAKKGSLVCKGMKEPSALISENEYFMHRKLLRQEPSGRFMEESGETGNGDPCQVGSALGDYSE